MRRQGSEATSVGEAAVEAAGLTVRRGKHTVFDGISVTVQHGQITGLLGPSGCGKTTLMRSIVGVQARAEDEIRVLRSELWQLFR